MYTVKKRKHIALFLSLILWLPLLIGCGQATPSEKIKDLDFTVVADSEVPEPLLVLIQDKKANPFCLTYKSTDGYYLCQGFGAKPTTGYSITVEELYLTEDSIYINNVLLGPAQDEFVLQIQSYPYIVVKTEKREEPVIFKQ